MSSPPTTLGQYEIIREIARSNDIVYEAYDPRFRRTVAVKELAIPPNSTPQQAQDRIERFQREAQAVGSLNHANIMTVYSFAEDAGRYFMAMEFLDGVTLRKEIDTKGTIAPERAVEIVAETLDGLAHAHAKGIIHRDIKPDNIQIVSSGEVKITDFGIARITYDKNLTIDGQVFGTPSYMSPEQVVGKEIDPRSDLFSVGVMLYEMLAGVKPFVGDSVVTITYNIVNATPDPPPTIPRALWDVIAGALDKSPSGRHRDAAEMRERLLAAHRAMSAPAPDPVAPWQVGAPGAGFQASPVGFQGAPANPYAPVTPPSQILGQIPPQVLNAPPGTGSPWGGPPQGYGQVPYGSPVPSYGPAYGQLPPGLPGGGMTPPIYYPPLPRAPMFKPETRAAIGRFVTVLVVVGLLFAICVYAFIAILTKVAEPKTARAPGTRVASSAVPVVPVSAPRASASAPPETVPVPESPGASSLESLRSRCETGESLACRDLAAAAGDRAEAASGPALVAYLRLAAEGYAGSGRPDEAVKYDLYAAEEMRKGGAPMTQVRSALYDAEDHARGDASAEALVAQAKLSYGLSN